MEKAKEVSRIRVENLQRALEAGVKVVMGTDAGTNTCALLAKLDIFW